MIRKATLSDLPDLQSLFVDTIQNVCKGDYSDEQINVWTSSVENSHRWRDMIEHQYVILLEENNAVLGFGSLENGHYVDFLYVHAQHQGKGIAHKIFSDLKRESLRRGFQTLSSDVSKTARPFFEKNGFIVEKENRRMIKGVEIVNFSMRETRPNP